MMYSNCFPPSGRGSILSEFITLAPELTSNQGRCFGGSANGQPYTQHSFEIKMVPHPQLITECGERMHNLTAIHLQEEQKKHIFGFALENINREPGYVSEKIYQVTIPSRLIPIRMLSISCFEFYLYCQVLQAGAIPIARHTAPTMLTDYIPCTKCVLWLDDFGDDISKLVVEMKRIASNESAFNEYMEWKKNPNKEILEKLTNQSMTGDHLICRIAEKHLEYQANKGNYAHPWEMPNQPGVAPFRTVRVDGSSHSFLINEEKNHFETLDNTWPQKAPVNEPSWPTPGLKLRKELKIPNKTDRKTWQIDLPGLILPQSQYTLENFVTGKRQKKHA